MARHVAVIAVGGEASPSTRLRILQYLPALQREGFTFSTYFVPQGLDGVPLDERALSEVISEADVVFVQRVLAKPILRALKQLGKPVIFDFDDALHYIRPSQYEHAVRPTRARHRLVNTYRAFARGSRFYSRQKTLLDQMLSLAEVAIVGNRWLLEELSLAEDRTVVLPTSVWLDGVPCKVHRAHRPVTVGWIGLSSSLIHLDQLSGVFAALDRRYPTDIEFVVVSSAPPRGRLPSRFVQWSPENERKAVSSFDIGIMPLKDDPYSRGKCAFKAVYYMSRGVPAVASPVGANTDLITHGVDGYLPRTDEEWIDGISSLLADAELRSEMGRRARMTIEERYSARAVAQTLGNVLRCLGNARGRSGALTGARMI